MEILLYKQYHSISFIELHLRWKVQLYKLISNVVSAPTDSHPSSVYFITISTGQIGSSLVSDKNNAEYFRIYFKNIQGLLQNILDYG